MSVTRILCCARSATLLVALAFGAASLSPSVAVADEVTLTIPQRKGS